jgi:flagellar motor switch/type III secretory pathway protein FliN
VYEFIKEPFNRSSERESRSAEPTEPHSFKADTHEQIEGRNEQKPDKKPPIQLLDDIASTVECRLGV